MPRIDLRRPLGEPRWKSSLRNVDEAFAEAADLVPFCATGLIVSVLMMTAGFTVVRPSAPFPSAQLAARPNVTAVIGNDRSVAAPARTVSAPSAGDTGKFPAARLVNMPGEIEPSGG
jgi:hypothetical protein